MDALLTAWLVPGICLLAALLMGLDELLASRRERRHHDTRGG